MRFRKGDLTVGCSLGRKLQMWRAARGWNQADLVDEVNRQRPGVRINQSTVSRIESGVKLDYRDVVAVAETVGVDLDWLGVSEDDQRKIAEDQHLRAEVAGTAAGHHRNGVARRRRGTVKSETGNLAYALLSA